MPLWMNLKDPSTQKPSVPQDSDYFYEYLDYQQDNTSASPSPSSVSTISVPTQTVKITQKPAQTPHQQKNATSPVKKQPAMPPSPSSSGFTFFGVPLPSLNFNLWGHSGRKAERKESSSLGNRPGRYRFFPPTEPEIHRGGFVPLPRAQSGFVPIVDPRLTYEKRMKHENITRPLNASGTVALQQRGRKSGNNTVAKAEMNAVSRTSNKSRTEFREREELSTASTLDRSAVLMSSFESRRITSDAIKIVR